jgi:hypothetical protein
MIVHTLSSNKLSENHRILATPIFPIDSIELPHMALVAGLLFCSVSSTNHLCRWSQLDSETNIKAKDDEYFVSLYIYMSEIWGGFLGC